MKKLFVLTALFAFSAQAVSIDKAEYFKDTAQYLATYNELTAPYNLKEKILVSGPFLDKRTKKAFIVMNEKDEKCFVITAKSKKSVSCSKAIKGRMNAQAPLLDGFEKAGSEQLSFLAFLNGIPYEKKVSVYYPVGDRGHEISYITRMNLRFSEDFKSVMIDSLTDTGSVQTRSYATLVVKSIQFRVKEDGSEEIAVWVHNSNGFYAQEAAMGRMTYLNPKLLNVKVVDDLFEAPKWDDVLNTYAYDREIKEEYKPMMEEVYFNYFIIKRGPDLDSLNIEFHQNVKNDGTFSAQYNRRERAWYE